VKLRQLVSSRKVRLGFNVGMILLGAVVTALAGKHFMSVGWPLQHANTWLVAASAFVFLVAYGVKAYGWKLLFLPGERPCAGSLVVAGGAAAVTGIALPGRFDDAVRIAVVRRHRGCPAGVRTLMLSLVTLGLIDTLALSPLAGSAAVAADVPGALRAGLIAVAAAGVVAGLLVVALPRLRGRVLEFRVVRWLVEHSPSSRTAGASLALITAHWALRALACALLLAALGMGLSMTFALVFLCAGAASAALPIAPAGAATQAGAGAGALVAAGMTTTQALSFALAAQLIVIVAGVAALVIATGVRSVAIRSGRRLVPAFA
jgi:Lysylphosphatidylglycerol synthase TM region